MQIHFVLSSMALAACVCLSVVAVFHDPFHPAQYPSNALHWVGIAWAFSIGNDSRLKITLSIIVSLTATLILLLSANSYFPNWDPASDNYPQRVYQGTTTPYWNVKRITNTERDDGMYRARFGITLASALLVFMSSFSHISAFFEQYEQVAKDEEEKPRPSLGVWISFGAALILVGFDAIVGLLPESRWVVVDSPHTALIAGLLVFWPKGLVRFTSTALIVVGTMVSCFSLGRTIRAVETGQATWLSISTYRTAYVQKTFGVWYFEPLHDEDGAFAFSSSVLHATEWVLVMLGAFVGAYRIVCG